MYSTAEARVHSLPLCYNFFPVNHCKFSFIHPSGFGFQTNPLTDNIKFSCDRVLFSVHFIVVFVSSAVFGINALSVGGNLFVRTVKDLLQLRATMI